MPDADGRWKYGLLALGVGVVALLVSVVVVGLAWPEDESRAGVLASVIGAVSAIVGAYFGVQVGGAEARTAKDSAAEATKVADTERARAVKAEADKTLAIQANAEILARPHEAPSVLEQFRIQ